MLDKYESVTGLDATGKIKRCDTTRANPLMWREVKSSRQAQQDRYDKHLVANIRPLAIEDEDMQGMWEGFDEYQEEREAERSIEREEEDREKMEW